MFDYHPSTPIHMLLVILCAAVGMSGCDSPTTPQSLTLVASGDTAGWIVPCGCTSSQSGGLLKRADYVRRLREQQDVLLVDVGGAPGGASPYDRTKFEAILQGEMALNTAAHNLGQSEAALGAEYLRDVQQRLNAPLVSCNVRDRDSKPIAPPLRIVAQAGRRIAIVGVLSPTLHAGDLQIDPPNPAIRAALKEHSGEYDLVVVLAYLPEQELRELSASLPEADVLLGGPTLQSIPPEPIGPAVMASATNKGKFVIELHAPDREHPQWSGVSVELGDEYGDDSRQQQNLQAFYAELAKHDFTPAETSFVQPLSVAAPPDYRVAGEANCRDCHEADCQIWKGSRHAHAWSSLRQTGAEVDSYCQQCHTTGYGLPGGFQSAATSGSLQQVGCESCHGPSSAHAADPVHRTPFQGRAAQRCVECHDRDNSPQFDYRKYWSEITHGQDEEDSSP